jgi:hypothetical protein
MLACSRRHPPRFGPVRNNTCRCWLSAVAPPPPAHPHVIALYRSRLRSTPTSQRCPFPCMPCGCWTHPSISWLSVLSLHLTSRRDLTSSSQSAAFFPLHHLTDGCFLLPVHGNPSNPAWVSGLLLHPYMSPGSCFMQLYLQPRQLNFAAALQCPASD